MSGVGLNLGIPEYLGTAHDVIGYHVFKGPTIYEETGNSLPCLELGERLVFPPDQGSFGLRTARFHAAT
jgi:hypothetical protein